MQKLSELVGGLNSIDPASYATLIKVAFALKCSVDEMWDKIAEFGPGMIYTRGVIMQDTPSNRYRLTESYGVVMILYNDGTVALRTRANRGQITRKLHKIASKQEKSLRKSEIENYRKRKATENMFRDGQTMPSPKRQGKANSHGDIGKYVPHRATSLNFMQKVHHTTFKVINIPNA